MAFHMCGALSKTPFVLMLGRSQTGAVERIPPGRVPSSWRGMRETGAGSKNTDKKEPHIITLEAQCLDPVVSEILGLTDQEHIESHSAKHAHQTATEAVPPLPQGNA